MTASPRLLPELLILTLGLLLAACSGSGEFGDEPVTVDDGQPDDDDTSTAADDDDAGPDDDDSSLPPDDDDSGPDDDDSAAQDDDDSAAQDDDDDIAPDDDDIAPNDDDIAPDDDDIAPNDDDVIAPDDDDIAPDDDDVIAPDDDDIAPNDDDVIAPDDDDVIAPDDDDIAPDDDDSAGPDLPAIEADFAADLEAELADLFAQYSPPGMVLSVKTSTNAVWSSAFGVSDTSAGTAMAVDDRFKAGEITRGFVGAMVLQLEDEGEIELWQIVPLWYTPAPATWYMTVNQAMTNTGGVPDYRQHASFDPDLVWTAADLASLAISMPVVNSPGSQWENSATGMVVASLIAEDLVGQAWEQEVEDRFITPLELDDTWIPTGSAGWGDVIPGYTGLVDVTDDNHPSAYGGSGAMVSTAPDLATWGQALYSGDVLGDSLGALTGEPFSTVAQYSYTLATVVYQETEGGPQLWGHASDLPGYSVWLGFRQEHQTAMVLMANDDSFDPMLASLDFWSIIENHVGFVAPPGDDDDSAAAGSPDPEGQHNFIAFKPQLPHVGPPADPSHDGVQLTGWWDFDNDGETIGHFTVMSADFSSGSPTGGVSCEIEANGSYDPGDLVSGITGTLDLQTWNFTGCPAWPDGGIWNGYLPSHASNLYFVPLEQVPTDWVASWSGASADMGGITNIGDYLADWLATTGAGLGAVETPYVVLGDVSDIVDAESEVPPWGFFGFTWQAPGDM